LRQLQTIETKEEVDCKLMIF